MSISVELPELGESVVEGTVARWLVKAGDRVEVDQPVVEVTTDKVDAEIPSPVAGVVVSLEAAEGDVVEVGAVLARIDPEGEASAEDSGSERKAASQSAGSERKAASQSAGSEPREEAPSAEREAPKEAPSAEREAPKEAPSAEREAPKEARSAERGAPREGSEEPPPEDSEDEPRATPVARRVAEERGVDLRSVEGTGPGGRIRKADVEEGRPSRAKEGRKGEAPRRPAPPREAPRRAAAREGRPTPDFGHYALQEGDEVTPMSPLRRLVAQHMVFSKQHAPHVGTVAEIDMGAVVALRRAHKASFQETHGVPLTYLPFVVHATVHALRDHPEMNASVLDDAIVVKRDVHVGIAVETEKGLVVPVVRHADRLSLAGLAAAIEDLSTRARNKKLSADDLRGGTFTVSNPGRQGNLYGFAIINQPQVGILRMGEMVKRPVVREVDGADAILIRPMMHLALSYDHRAVDGAPANAFLHRVKELLEGADFDL